MAEWLKAHDSKSCGQQCLGGSNPLASAIQETTAGSCFCYTFGMKITKYEHSGIAIEKDGKTLLFDPVEFEQKLPEFTNVIGIVVTHKHGDHSQPAVIERIMAANPAAELITSAETAVMVNGAIAAKAGDMRDVSGFKLEFFGQDHAAIIPGQVPCDNIGVVVDGEIMNPGDSFDVPETQPKVLFVPIAAPWCKVCESIDFARRAKPNVVIPIHDAVLSGLGMTFNCNWLKNACAEIGAEFVQLGFGESFEA